MRRTINIQDDTFIRLRSMNRVMYKESMKRLSNNAIINRLIDFYEKENRVKQHE